MCWVSSLSSMISKFHFSLYLHSKLDIWFLLLLFLSFSPFQAFSLLEFFLSLCSFPSNWSPDESDPLNRRTEINGFDRPFGRQRVRNLFTRLEWVEWRFDPKPDPLDPWTALMKAENSQKVFSVSITLNSQIREWSDGNKKLKTELWLANKLFFENWDGSHHFWELS